MLAKFFIPTLELAIPTGTPPNKTNSEIETQSLAAKTKTRKWDSNGTQSQNHLVCKRTLNHLDKLTKWLNG